MLVVDGGATMNPSTYELLAGIHAAPGEEVLVLPNSPNVILAAEKAAGLSDKPARVVPTTAPQEGLAALLAFDPGRSSPTTPTRWASRGALSVGGVAPAARATRRAASPPATPWATRAASWWPGATRPRRWPPRSSASPRAELLTCIAGEGPPLGRDAVESRVPDGVEVEYHEGGQPAWWWLLCAE